MAMTGLIRLSFQSVTEANQSANKALTGVIQGKGNGPFYKVGTALFECRQADDAEVARALTELAQTLVVYSDKIDFVGMMLTRNEAADTEDVEDSTSTVTEQTGTQE